MEELDINEVRIRCNWGIAIFFEGYAELIKFKSTFSSGCFASSIPRFLFSASPKRLTLKPSLCNQLNAILDLPNTLALLLI